MLLSGMLLFSVMNMSGQKKRASSEALAQVVASELQAARALAIRDRSPVAVCFPTQGGTVAHSQSLYLMEGLARPRITRLVNYGREFEQSVIAIGCWGGATITRPSSGENYTAPAVQRWLGNGFKDFALVFTPDGAVTSNDLPLVDGAYHVLVAGQVASNASSAPPGAVSMTSTPPTYFDITKVYAAQTVTISPSGSLSVQSGVASNGGVVVSPTAFSMDAPAPPPSLPTIVATAPTIRLIEAQPRPTLNPKVSVQQGRVLTLKVEATDVNGDPLSCTWDAQKLAGGDPGVFSAPARSPMQWDAQRQLWTLTTTWSPPAGTAVGDGYKLTCTVTDPEGLSATRVEPVLDPVKVVPPVRFIYSYPNPSNHDIATINDDGSAARRLTYQSGNSKYPNLSRDGQKIVFSSDYDIYTMNADGTDRRQISATHSDSFPIWSADGRQIFYQRFGGGDSVWVMKADGSGQTKLSVGFGTNYGLRQSPDGRYVAYLGMVGAPGVGSVSGEIIVGEYVNDGVNPPRIIDSTNLTNNSHLRIADYLQCWFPDNSGRFLYNSVDPQGLPLPSYTMLRTLNMARLVDNGPGSSPRFSMTDQVTLFGTNSMYDDYKNPQISPDLRKIVSPIGFGPLYVVDLDLAATPPTLSNRRQLPTVSDSQPGNFSRL